jgi:hypothetical protein
MRIFAQVPRIGRNISHVPESQVLDYKIPKDIKFKKIEYTGPEILKVSLVMERPLSLLKEIHPLDMEMEEINNRKSVEEARHEFGSFDDYYAAWLSEAKKPTEKKKKAEKIDVSSSKRAFNPKHPANPPPKTNDEIIEESRNEV